MISRIFNILIFSLFLFNSFYIFTHNLSNNINEEEQILVENKQHQEEISKTANKENIEEEEQLELLDQIESEVTYLGSENLESNIITKQEVERRGFDGNTYTVADLEDQDLADQFSKVLKANITNDDINRNLKKNGMTEKDICDIAQRWGYISKDEFFEDLKKVYRANAALNYEVESQLVASNDDIQIYYKQHIDEYKEEAKYIVETAFIQYPSNYDLEIVNEVDEDASKNNEEAINNKKINKEKEKMRVELEKYISSKIIKPNYVNWDSIVEINHSEITKDNEFLIDLEIGSMYMREADNGFILYKMKNKKPMRIIPVENVQEDIVIKLKKERYPEIIKGIRDKLRSQAIIVHPTQCVPTYIEE